jgi:hypothetical protein
MLSGIDIFEARQQFATEDLARDEDYDPYLDWYDQILTHTFPASDAIQNW